VLGSPKCPTCRAEFAEKDLEPDIVMIAKMEKIYGQLAHGVSIKGDSELNLKECYTLIAKNFLSGFLL
jgi:hypothetical protein